MPEMTLQYTRSRGKRHTYDIALTTNGYAIFLNGNLINCSGPFIVTFGVVEGGALHLLAMDHIETLDGIAEE